MDYRSLGSGEETICSLGWFSLRMFHPLGLLSFTPWLQPGGERAAWNLPNRFNGFPGRFLELTQEQTVETVPRFLRTSEVTGLKPQCE